MWNFFRLDLSRVPDAATLRLEQCRRLSCRSGIFLRDHMGVGDARRESSRVTLSEGVSKIGGVRCGTVSTEIR